MKTLLLTLLTFSSLVATAQWGDEEMDEQAAWRDRVFTGGGFGLGLTSNVDYIAASPLVGYKITPKLATGLSFSYRYTNYKYVTPKVTTHDYGVAPFVRFNFYQNFFLHSEYEYLNYQVPTVGGEKIRNGFSSLLAGGGMFQPIGRRTGFFVLALYNFSYRNPSSTTGFQPYNNPLIIRAGLTAGF